MGTTDEQVTLFVEACILIAETDPKILVGQKNPQLSEKLRYFAPSAMEALAQLEVLIRSVVDEDAQTDA